MNTRCGGEVVTLNAYCKAEFNIDPTLWAISARSDAQLHVGSFSHFPLVWDHLHLELYM